MQVRLSDGGETKARRGRGERWQLAYSATVVGCTGPVICYYGHAVVLHHCFRRPHGTNMSDPPMRDENLLIGSIRFENGKCT